MKQLNIFEQIHYEEQQEELKKNLFKAEESYRNGFGELLPWEEPEYLKKINIGGV